MAMIETNEQTVEMTKQPDRIQIKETSLICDNIFEGPFEAIIHTLQKFQNKDWEGIKSESIGHHGAVDYYLYRH